MIWFVPFAFSPHFQRDPWYVGVNSVKKQRLAEKDGGCPSLLCASWQREARTNSALVSKIGGSPQIIRFKSGMQI